MQIFANAKDIKVLREKNVHVIFTDEFLEGFCPKPYKKLKYLLALYNVGSNEFMDIFKFGSKIREASNNNVSSYVKILDCIVDMETEIEPLFGILKVQKLTGFIPCIFYAEYSAKWHSHYIEHKLEASSIKGLD